jgi:hypothetical protein
MLSGKIDIMYLRLWRVDMIPDFQYKNQFLDIKIDIFYRYFYAIFKLKKIINIILIIKNV